VEPRSGIPPGLHLYATCRPHGLEARQIRILGDDQRGYLITGLADVPDGGDFWFETLPEAIARAEALGVEVDGWTEITNVNDVSMLRGQQ
jgi:hypothetical protein